MDEVNIGHVDDITLKHVLIQFGLTRKIAETLR